MMIDGLILVNRNLSEGELTTLHEKLVNTH
jgi:hypothetical protein